MPQRQVDDVDEVPLAGAYAGQGDFWYYGAWRTARPAVVHRVQGVPHRVLGVLRRVLGVLHRVLGVLQLCLSGDER